MTTYTHHISGRLRTRYPQLKNNPARARMVEEAIRKINGVFSVEASTVTGSLLIRYDERAADGNALLNTLYQAKQKLGLVQSPVMPAPIPRQTATTSLGETFADKVIGMAVEKCIERSAVALVAALL